MQIVIDIDERYFEIIKATVESGDDYKPFVLIAHGTPLPKGHGRIVDIDKLIDSKCNECGHIREDSCIIHCYEVRRMVDAPTLIEADKVESEGEG